MSNNDSLQNIANRLFKENICAVPLDKKSLETVDRYMNYYIPYCDLCRRLSDIELNYVQIAAEAEEASLAVSEDKNSVSDISRKLTDQWIANGYLQQIFFSSESSDYTNICSSYSTTLENIRDRLKSISISLLTLSETAAQIRACAASFIEVYKESKLAIYAAMLNRDVESVLDCRATSLQAHASAKECERLAAKLMGNARICTRIINIINNMIIEVNQSLNFDTYEYAVKTKISPMKANNSICTAIALLDSLFMEK